MEYLPAEIQLKILKNLNFDELFSIKQINKYFFNFINKYEDELAHKRFESLYFIQASDISEMKYITVSEFSNSHFVRDFMDKHLHLSNNLREKWQSALDKQIPVFILDKESMPDKIDPLLDFNEDGNLRKKYFRLRLPLIPQNIEELKFVRYWLLKISKCVFDDIYFNEFIFNPEMIKLLFNNEEINKLKFNCESGSILFNHTNIYFWNFIFDRLFIDENLTIIFYEGEEHQETAKQENNFLLELLSNEGYRIPKVILYRPNDNRILLYNNLINHLETSTDLSKMVNKIEFDCEYWLRSELIVRGVEMSKSNKRKKYYKIKNINDPKMMFFVKWEFNSSDGVGYIEINRLN